jgi:hypothetical protein
MTLWRWGGDADRNSGKPAVVRFEFQIQTHFFIKTKSFDTCVVI